MPRHRELTGPAAAHPPGIISDVDPGAVGAGKLWIDTSSGTPPWAFWLRNETDDAWEATGGSAGALAASLAALAPLTPAADMAPYYTGATTAALTGLSAYMRTVLDDVDAASARTTLGLGIGTAVQAYDAELQAIAGLASAANKLPYFTGAGAASMADFTSFARTLLDDVDAPAMRATLLLGTLATLNSVAQANVSGLTTADSPQFAGINVGHATNTTITQTAPGQIAVEGVNVSMAGHAHAVTAVTTVLTGSGNYNLPAGAVFLHVLMVGAGAGGGSVAATAAGEAANGGGGGGGGWAEAHLDASTLDSVIAYVVGAGGPGGTAGGGGGPGGDTSFGAAGKAYRMIAKGGGGGATGANTAAANRPAAGTGGVPGTVPAGGATGTGSDGSNGLVISATLTAQGSGGGSRLGGATRGPTASATGNPGSSYGGGGSGGSNAASQAARDGGAGANGTIIVTAFFGS